MSRQLDHLVPDLEEKVPRVVRSFEARHRPYQLLIYCTWRSHEDQARIYRESRGIVQIRLKARQLEEDGYDELAKILIDVGPVYGTLGLHRTRAAPGESWHQYGQAWDAVPMLGGKLLWDADNQAWFWYHQAALRQGLNTLSFEKPHVQIPERTAHPLRVLPKETVISAIEGPSAWRIAA